MMYMYSTATVYILCHTALLSVNISRNEGKQKNIAFQQCFGQWSGYQDLHKTADHEHYTLLYTPLPLNKPPYP